MVGNLYDCFVLLLSGYSLILDLFQDWIFDAIHGFFASPRWQGPVQTYIEKYCIYFMETNQAQSADQVAKLKEEQTMIHREFTSLIDSLMQSLLKDIGIDQQQFLHACKEAKSRKSQWKIIKQILVVDDFEEFKKIMVKRNKDLERQALQLMIKQEHRQIQAHMNQHRADGNEENSFSSGEEDSDSDDDAIKAAIEQSKKAAEEDQKRREAKYGGNAQFQAMSETDGFKMAMELSKKESKQGRAGAQPKPKPTPQQNNFEDMMMSTAGFNMILEQSKKEEEERLKKEQNIKINEDKLLQRGIQ